MKSGQKKITKHDLAVYDAVYRWYQESGPYPPSIRDIAELARSGSTNSVRYSLTKLCTIGVIEFFPETARAIRLSGETWEIPPKRNLSVNMSLLDTRVFFQKNCGHLIGQIVSTDEGTHYCKICEQEAR